MSVKEGVNGYYSEAGRAFASEYALVEKPAEAIANKIPADAITVFGAFAGITGSYLLGFPHEAIQIIQKVSGGHIKLTCNQTRVTGALLLGISYACDVLDGAVARKSEKGETKYGKVLDAIANKMIDISPAVFILSNAQTTEKRTIWESYRTLAPVSTMIRSRGLQHDIPISKTGFCARIGRLPFLIASLIFQQKRDVLGKVLSMQLVIDCIYRYTQIIKTGNREAIEAVQNDVFEYITLFLGSQVIGGKSLEKELTIVGLELAKLTQVKIKEAYG